MAYIYQITNKINGKIYIGKTEFSVEKRWKEHCKDAFSDNKNNRPLYSAMKKYGIENFLIEILEETDSPEEREVYWIEKKKSYKYGYNATKGGDGRKYLDYDLIIATYKIVNSITETAKIIGCHEDSVVLILESNDIKPLTSQEVNMNKYGKMVNQYDLQKNYIQTFPSLKAAAKSLGKEQGVSHISDVCKGKRQTAYGYYWKFYE